MFVIAPLLAACASSPRAPNEIELRQAKRDVERRGFEETQSGLLHDLSLRESEIIAEIDWLGPDHPWAGCYERRSATEWERILIAPEAGCLCTSRDGFGAFTDVNWGRVSERDGWLHVEFDQPQNTEHAFEETYGLKRRDAGRALRVIEAEGVQVWELNRYPEFSREFYAGAELGQPLEAEIPFARGGELLTSYTSFQSARARYRSDSNSPQVIPLDPEIAAKSELQNGFSDSRLSGWVMRAYREGDLVFSLEDPRKRAVAGYATVSLRAASPTCFVAVIRPDPSHNAQFREFVLYRVDETHLSSVMRERIFVGARGDAETAVGWEHSGAEPCLTAGSRNPIGIWSWNGGDSTFAASLELQPGCITGMWARTEWHEQPLAKWPHPVWVLYFWYGAK